MPRKRRTDKRKSVLPPVLAALDAGGTVDYSVENHNIIVSAVFFFDPPLSEATLQRAAAALNEWRPLWLADDEGRRRIDGVASI